LGALHADAAYDLVGGDDVNRLGLEPCINKPTNGADPPPRSSNSSVRLQTTSALDLSVRCAAFSIIRTGTPYRASSQAMVIPTGPAPMIRMGTLMVIFQFQVILGVKAHRVFFKLSNTCEATSIASW
jgi:hypothetical protein